MADTAAEIDAVDPETALKALETDPGAVLVDVRSAPEWTFVGLPDISATGRPLWRIEWAAWPGMTPDPDGFAAALAERMAGAPVRPTRLLFICRSGTRSRHAAQRIAAGMAAQGHGVRCTNVDEGFEGGRDARGRRGTTTGWKARGLPWSQG